MDEHRTCALLADRHAALAEGVRDLLETRFGTVYLVGDARSLREGARRLRPAVVVLDLALASSDVEGLLARAHAESPESKLVVLTLHDEPAAAAAILAAGADAVVLKRTLIRDLLNATDAVLRGKSYVSRDIDGSRPSPGPCHPEVNSS